MSFEIEKEVLKRQHPLYVKIHGSIGWRYSENRDHVPIVMGTGKKDQLKTHPLLQEYFELFEKIISQSNTSLLVIGIVFAISI